MKTSSKYLDFEEGVDPHSVGFHIDLLIRSNLKNWAGKELFFNPRTPLKLANQSIYGSFQANKIRNSMITQINLFLHHGPAFHFRNYHNY